MTDNNINELSEIDEYLTDDHHKMRKLEEITESHPMSVPQYYMELIDWDNPHDPIRKTAIPSLKENNTDGSFDTSGEEQNTKLKGLQHKYRRTALVLVTNKCAMYCRFCFRKRLAGVSEDEIAVNFSEIYDYISVHDEIRNVLLSGGDPLTLDTQKLIKIIEPLGEIPHLRFVRIGSRIPVVKPDRILEDKQLVKFMEKFSEKKKQLYITTHFNHPREITKKSKAAVRKLIRAGVMVNNQTVLLKGVNDDPHVMADLQSKLSGFGCVPYYVFQCRPVSRVKDNFQVPLIRASAIIEEARKHLDGVSKRFRFVMSHETGKIQILGYHDGFLIMKYLQAKDENMMGKIFRRKMEPDTGWLEL